MIAHNRSLLNDSQRLADLSSLSIVGHPFIF
jgi:hypothetical protein